MWKLLVNGAKPAVVSAKWLSAPISTSCVRLTSDPSKALSQKEAPLIETEKALMLPGESNQKQALDTSITVPTKVNISPISGIPEEHIKTRRVRIYQPPKNAMQSGTNNIQHWLMEFDNRERWENPLMGWCSSGDPMSNLKVEFATQDDAIAHCEKNGWSWFLDTVKTDTPLQPKSYALNYSWNKRTRVSTK